MKARRGWSRALAAGIALACAAGPGSAQEGAGHARLHGLVRSLLQEGVAQRAFPGAVARVMVGARVVAEVAVGRETYDPAAPPVRADSVFDLASLTKVCATTPAVLRLVARGRLSFETPVAELVEGFRGRGKERVTIQHLLAHASGLPAYVRFFRTLRGKDTITAAAAAEPLMAEPGTRTIYSDLGFVLLASCLERATGRTFEEVVRDQVFDPLGMTGARFTRTGRPIDAVPTEDCPWRGRVVRGEVHDENAYAMGGVSGHAGMFATAADVARVGRAFLRPEGYLPAALAARAVRPAGLVAGSTRGLGWDTFRPGGAGGTLLSPRAFGHTGFTGTSIWCDPDRDLCMVLLTNRVHPTRVNGRIAGIRRRFADSVVRWLARTTPLRVTSFNIRRGFLDDGPRSWRHRRAVAIEALTRLHPHLLGLQEALPFQRRDLLRAFPRYRVAGLSHEGLQLGELTPILYDPGRLVLEKEGNFWLHPAGRALARAWDAAFPRICAWAVFRDRISGRRFLHVNTHLDNKGERARVEGARLLVQHLARFADLPAIVTGDLNARERTEPLRILRAAGLRDSFRVVHPGAVEVRTGHRFGGLGDATRRDKKIDYVLVRGPWTVTGAGICRHQREGIYPSDHFPVWADLALPAVGARTEGTAAPVGRPVRSSGREAPR